MYEQSLACQQSFQLRTLDEKRLTEAALLAISAQAAKTEPLFAYLQRISDASVNELRSFAWNRSMKNPARWKNEDRLSDFFTYADAYGGIEVLAHDFLAKPRDVRQMLCDEVRWFGAKTASFFYYFAGGNRLATIDMHVLEQTYGCGLDIPSHCVIPTVRKSGVTKDKAVRERPTKRQYMNIEQELIDFWDQYDVFPRPADGSVDVARWFTVFWLAGIHQDRLIQGQSLPTFSYPFSDQNREPQPSQSSLF